MAVPSLRCFGRTSSVVANVARVNFVPFAEGFLFRNLQIYATFSDTCDHGKTGKRSED